MKLKFEPNLEYQKNAIDSTIGLLNGQKIENDALFSVPLNLVLSEGVGNNINLTDNEILENLRNIQLKNGLKQSTQLNELEFDIEMETGTGKTYVYLKTILEMNKQYGFKKFIILVPSIAIKEGVFKNLEITKEHFKNLYNNVQYDFYFYNSKSTNQIHSFSTSNHISIMIINIDSFNKKQKNKIHQINEGLNGFKPIDLIKGTNPIVIVDEPQSLSTDKSKESISDLNPSLILKYSATHKKISNLIYKLDPIDAFEQKLVKRIEVLSIVEKIPSLKLISTKSDNTGISAYIKIEYQGKDQILSKEIKITKGSDIFELSNNIEKYRGLIVEEINTNPINEFVSFTSSNFILTSNSDINGEHYQDQLKKLQISSTIEEHLEKQLKLKKKGIKVLSLFFIDKVSNYRIYESSAYSLGKYGVMFEEEFIRIASKNKYKELFLNKNISLLAKVIHSGYFSKDTKGIMKDTNGNAVDDNSTYELIMKDKEKLLSLNEDLSFIFSHSALREGWDNPNVFQICTLNETKSTMKKRQEIGRGLRLCVNQEGERLYNDSFNILTIIANESYESFAKELQKDYQEEGIKFNTISRHSFSRIINEGESIGDEKSMEIFDSLVSDNYINKDGLINDKFNLDYESSQLNLSTHYQEIIPEIITILQKSAKKLPIQNANKKINIKINENIYLSENFKLLWEKIKYKTSYNVDFNTNELIIKVVDKINNIKFLKEKNITKTKANLELQEKGVMTTEINRSSVYIGNNKKNYPDLVSKIQENTNLTRKTIIKILNEVNNFESFKMNPEDYINKLSYVIKNEMQNQMVDGIKYTKNGENHFYEQMLFNDNEISGYIDKNLIPSSKNIYNYVIFDSNIERSWAESMNNNSDIILYTKLPKWFKIPTPLGSYNPDWAILLNDNNEQKLYFVIETKGSVLDDQLRPAELNKIKCGKKHFNCITTDLKFEKYDEFNKFIEENINNK